MIAAYVATWFLLPFALSADGEALSWKLKEGDRFYVELKTSYDETTKFPGREVRQGQEMTLLMAVRVVRRTGQELVLEQKVKSIQATRTGGLGRQKDKSLEKMQGASITVTFDSKMNVSRIAGLEDVAKRLAGNEQADAEALGFLKSVFDGFFRYWASETYVYLPAKPAQPNETWEQRVAVSFSGFGTLRVKKKITYKGLESVAGKKLAKLAVTATFGLELGEGTFGREAVKVTKADIKAADYDATVHFDTIAGRVVQSESRMKTDMAMTLEVEQETIQAQGQRTQTIAVRILDKSPLDK